MPTPLERLVRGALGAYGAALVLAPVASEYVQASAFAYVVPAVVGVLCGEAAVRAAGAAPRQVRGAAALLAVLSVALGFRVEGSTSPFTVHALGPLLCALAGAAVWTAPPRRRASGARP